MKKINFFLVLVISLFWSASIQAQITKDWAQFGRYAEANAQLKKVPKAVFMGNSITDHWAKMDGSFFKNHDYLGRGISGQTTSEMLVRFRSDVIDLHPKVVVIMAGINDIAHNNGVISIENMMANITSMCELAQLNDVIPILCSVMPASDFPWRRGMNPAPKVIKLNQLIKDYAHLHQLKYVDYHKTFANKVNGMPEKYSKDGVHPNLAGYKIMEGIVNPIVQEVLNGK